MTAAVSAMRELHMQCHPHMYLRISGLSEEDRCRRASVELWSGRILQHYNKTTDPFQVYRIVAETTKSKKVLHPPHVTRKQHIAALIKALEADPRFECSKGFIYLSGKEPPAREDSCPIGPSSRTPYSAPAAKFDDARACHVEDLYIHQISVTYAQRSNLQAESDLVVCAPEEPEATAVLFPCGASMQPQANIEKYDIVDEQKQEIYCSTVNTAEHGDMLGLGIGDCANAVAEKSYTEVHSGVANEQYDITDLDPNPVSGPSVIYSEGTIACELTANVSGTDLALERADTAGGVKQQAAEPAIASSIIAPPCNQTGPVFYSQISEQSRNGRLEDIKKEGADTLKGFFGNFYKERSREGENVSGTRYVLADRNNAQALFREYALLGIAPKGPENVNGTPPLRAARQSIFMNIHEPFCFVTVGVQGAGKSHTLGCVLESCLIPFPQHDVIQLQSPMSGLVLHYDQNVTSVCEATGVIAPSPLLSRVLQKSQVGGLSSCLPRDKMIVLVSPSYYKQRLQFYGDYCIVKPLLFRWSSLTADHIKRIMRVKQSDNQLYIAVLLDLLRSYQRKGSIPSFKTFLSTIKNMCKGTQSPPLLQRLSLLESLVLESDMNALFAGDGGDLVSTCNAGTLVIVDLTDPLLASDEANGIFQVLTEQYRSLHIPLHPCCGKVLVLDEAHKFMDGVATDGLSQSIVNMARLMRHDGMRLVVSTQCPKALAPELLELVSVAVLHKFHSNDWFRYLSTKLPLTDHAWNTISKLQSGHALVFSSQILANDSSGVSRTDTSQTVDLGLNTFEIQIRPRITADRGETRKNDGRTSLL